MRLHRGLAAVPSSLLALGVVATLALSGCTSFSDTAAGRLDAGGDDDSGRAGGDADRVDRLRRADPAAHRRPARQRPGSGLRVRAHRGADQLRRARGRHPPAVHVRVVMAGQTDRIGSLVVNPGGPGASGADAAIGLALTLPLEVLSRFDIVGFDPRGVGPVDAGRVHPRRHEGAAHRLRAAADHRRAARRRASPSPRRSPTAVPTSTATPSARSTRSTPRGTWTSCGSPSATRS